MQAAWEPQVAARNAELPSPSLTCNIDAQPDRQPGGCDVAVCCIAAHGRTGGPFVLSSKRLPHKHKLVPAPGGDDFDRAASPLVALMLGVLAALPLSLCGTLAAVPLYVIYSRPCRSWCAALPLYVMS